MKVIPIAAMSVAFLGGPALYEYTVNSPKPINAKTVGFVMLKRAMERVDIAVGPKRDVNHLNCESTGEGNITCEAIGGAVYHVSFANKGAAPAFKLVGQRGLDGLLHVNAFEGVPPMISAYDVAGFTNAFAGRATVRTE